MPDYKEQKLEMDANQNIIQKFPERKKNVSSMASGTIEIPLKPNMKKGEVFLSNPHLHIHFLFQVHA